MKRKLTLANHTICGLVDKRIEIADQMAELSLQLMRLKSDSDALDTAILIFEPKFDPFAVKAKRVYVKNKYFNHDQMNTTVIDVVRKHGGPSGSADIFERVAVAAQIELEKADRNTIEETLDTVLYRLRDQGIFVEHSTEKRNIILCVIAD